MKLYLIRHAQTQPNKHQDAAQWQLTAKGEEQAKNLATHPLWDDVDCIVLSSEPKTKLTIEPVIAVRNFPIWVEGRFNELRRVGWVEDYVLQVDQAFSTPNIGVGEWEPAAAALDRFLDGVTLLRKRFIKENLALVGHGLTLSLYRAHLLGQTHVKLEDWQRLPFASVALVNTASERLISDFTTLTES